MKLLKYWLVIFFCTLINLACNSKKNKPEENKDILSLIIYPKAYDTILDCSQFHPDWTPYPCLKLEQKTFPEIISIYGEPNYIYIDTLLYGECKDGGTYDPDIEKMVLEIPFAKITYAYWKLSENKRLALYFIESNKQDIVFYGYQFNPYTIMME